MSDKTKHHDKRMDLQVLRGYSVLAVVIFHFFPNLLPYGYLGVDVFFVLSGYLIALVLHKKDCTNYLTYVDFYFKRIRRIVPMSALMIFLCSLCLLTMNQSELINYNYQSALAALLFATNLKKSDEEDEYFIKLTSATDLFTHIWSLSVEIQFYCLAPTILTIGKIVGRSQPFRLIVYLLSAATGSLIYYISLNDEIAFNSTVARLWQFMAGSIVFYCEQYNQERSAQGEVLVMNKYSAFKHCFSIFLIFSIAVISIKLFELETSTRLICTILAAAVIYIQSKSFILQSRFMNYMGDISYALYLVHWPIVCIITHYEITAWSVKLLAISICLILSIIVHETYEKWYAIDELGYLTLSPKLSFVLLAVLYTASIISLHSYHSVPNETIANPIKNDELLHFHDYDTLPVFDWRLEDKRNIAEEESKKINSRYLSEWKNNLKFKSCLNKAGLFGMCNQPNGTGQYKMMIIGNSYANNLGRVILKHFRIHSANINIYTIPTCETLLSSKKTLKSCDAATKKFANNFKRFKPEIVFIVQRWLKPEISINTTNIEDDSSFQIIMNNLAPYTQIAKKVFILQALFRPTGKQDNNTDADAAPMRKRMEEVSKRCANCVIFDIQHRHLTRDNSTFELFHPHTQLQYFETSLHYTPYGLRLIEPVIANMSKEFDILMRRNDSSIFTG